MYAENRNLKREKYWMKKTRISLLIKGLIVL